MGLKSKSTAAVTEEKRDSENWDLIFSAMKSAALPGIWSKGVAMARDHVITQEISKDRSSTKTSSEEDEIRARYSRGHSGEEKRFRIIVPTQVLSPRVTLWPEDEEWYCDCGDKADPCPHAIAVLVAARNGNVREADSVKLSKKSTSTAKNALKAPPQLVYRFKTQDRGLILERAIRHQGNETPLKESLVAYVGGIQSGRISLPMPAASKADYAVDQAIGGTFASDRERYQALYKALSEMDSVTLDGKPVGVSAKGMRLKAELREAGTGYLLKGNLEDATLYRGGIVLKEGTLYVLDDYTLGGLEREIFSSQGKFYSQDRESDLVADILPVVQTKMDVSVHTKRLPKVVLAQPAIELQTDKLPGEILVATARLVYRDIASQMIIGEMVGGKLVSKKAGVVPKRESAAEKELAQRVFVELNLKIDQPARFERERAAEFTVKARQWQNEESARNQPIKVRDKPLQVQIDLEEDRFEVNFEGLDGEEVLKAWKENRSYVSLINGEYVPLPEDWLNQYGEVLQSLLDAREENIQNAEALRKAKLKPGEKPKVKKLPRVRLIEAVRLCRELGQPVSTSLDRLRTLLEDHTRIPDFDLPADLQATLRDYQRAGVNWLCFLREAGLGALLADDMGLGKTLQAMCSVRGRTLIVSPTSVIYSWGDQINRFRPQMKWTRYYGPVRELDPKADVTLTSYGVLRLDADKLAAVEWDTIILDEAQTIKNPDSQVAQASHRLRGKFRIALSGTPIENRLSDLWSQMQFANPGLLGSADRFIEEYSTPAGAPEDEEENPTKGRRGKKLTAGQRGAWGGKLLQPSMTGSSSLAKAIGNVAENAAAGNTSVETLNDPKARLRNRIRPFILRRMKKEIAKELPPKTEIVLQCELTAEEKQVYDAVLAATQRDLVQQLGDGKGVFAALEALLRLRQACCHSGLLPGMSHKLEEPSSKLNLLLETLDTSIQNGHRALVFSQWTSLLDLIEREFKKTKIGYIRLDGSTRNRGDVVETFQKDDGPPVMLISLKAGGVGLTLTKADHIFIVDPWWNPAVEDQASDRAHRIGQTNPVLVHRLVASGTIEERILELQKKKAELAAAVLSDGAGALSITAQDILSLLK